MEITLAPIVPGTPPRGPLPAAEVCALLAEGHLAPDTLAWTPGRAEWVPVNALLGFAQPPMINSLPPPLATTVPAGEPRTESLAVASLLCGLGVCLLGFLSGIPAIVTGHLAQKRIRESHGRLKGGGFALTGLICGYVSLALFPIMLLAAIAVPGFLRARQRSQATAVLNDARVIDGAINQFAIEHAKRNGDPVRWEDLLPYLKPGSRLANSGGRDLLEQPYAFGRITAEDAQVKVHPETVQRFRDVVNDPAAFWGAYLPAGVDPIPTPTRPAPAPRPRRSTSATLPRGPSPAALQGAGTATTPWNCGCALSAA